MQQHPILNYIRLGQRFRFLHHAREGQPIHGTHWVTANLRAMLVELPAFGFVVTARAAENLLRPILTKLDEAPKDAALTAAQAGELSAAIEKLTTVMDAEAGGKVAYIATDKRYSVEVLLHDMGSLLRAGVFESLPDVARFDLTEAGKAIAYELPTAAAFHVLRATEDTLRVLYRSWVRTNRVGHLTWGAMTADMRKRRRHPPEALLNHLDHIRHNFRNPTDHPEKVYDSEEVQDLLALCCDAIGRMRPKLTAADRATKSDD